MTTDPQEKEESSQQERLTKIQRNSIKKLHNADIVELDRRTVDGVEKLQIQVYGPGTEEKEIYTVSGDFEIVGDNVVTDEDKARMKYIERVYDEAFRKEYKSDELVVYETFKNAVKNLWK